MTIDTVIDLGQTLAVFASLVFVGYQIRQHTRALKATSHHAITDSFNALNALIMTEPRVARVHRLGLAGLGNLDADEAVQFSFMGLAYMRIFETLYYQYKTGTMEEQLYEAELKTLKWQAAQPGFQEWWPVNPISFSAEFRTFIDGLIREAKAAAAAEGK